MEHLLDSLMEKYIGAKLGDYLNTHPAFGATLAAMWVFQKAWARRAEALGAFLASRRVMQGAQLVVMLAGPVALSSSKPVFDALVGDPIESVVHPEP